jgi:CheY-like chemotaxis protein/HPt (histidine-containing phosphotransfer) domain-containing protein
MKPFGPVDGSAPAPPPAREAGLPAILLVEDDPTTRAYLQAITEALPARVDTATCVAQALPMARNGGHALWLVDANLPDGSGVDLLQALRTAFPGTPALAHTAACDRGAQAALLDAGFADVLVKPMDARQWQAALRRHLGDAVACSADAQSPALETRPLWDDVAAARALGGDPAHVDALRGLFLAELPAQLQVLRGGDADARSAQLHRLRASCAFVGAARLEAAVRALQDRPADTDRLDALIQIADASIARQAPA